MRRALRALALALLLGETFAASVVSARLDLRNFGYRLTGADYSDLSFLSDDLLVISINQRGFSSVEPLFADGPESTIVVFDVKHANVTATAKMPVEKASNSLQAVSGNRLAVLNQKGLQFCDAALRCSPPIETSGPMFVSPQGKRLVVGGNGGSRRKVIDAESLKETSAFERGGVFQLVIPGDGAFLVSKNQFTDQSVTIQRPGKLDASVHIDSKGNFRELRFLNSESLGCLDHDASEVVVTDLEAKPIRRYKVEKAWRTGFLPTSSGTRFGIYEHGYTALNSALNLLDIDDGRPQNLQRVRVIDVSSGKEIYQLDWDPRPHLIKPALSPSGHRLARVRAGILEVFEVK